MTNRIAKPSLLVGGLIACLLAGEARNGFAQEDSPGKKETTGTPPPAQSLDAPPLETPPPPASSSTSTGNATENAAASDNAEKYQAFEKMLSGKRLVGRFTIKGQDLGNLRDEVYELQSVKKIEGKGDFWMFKAKVKYGDNSFSFPFPLEVKWAGDTPMITLTDFKFLGEGPFSARVVFHDGMYAGTWSHGNVTGHLFGQIEDSEGTEEVEEVKDAEATSDADGSIED